jgi:hypothetical protein
MQVIVELNTAREVMWALPGSSAPLTVSTPRAAIETDKLTIAQREMLYRALKAGKITSKTPAEQFFRPAPTTPKGETKPVSTIEVLQQKLAAENNQAAALAKEVLEGSVVNVKKSLLQVRDLKTLRIMLALEEGSKKRATVTKAIQDAIEAESKVISMKATQASGPLVQLPADPATVSYPGGTIDYDVVESEQTTIQVKIPPKG